jgi:site-specific recombinase XerD
MDNEKRLQRLLQSILARLERQPEPNKTYFLQFYSRYCLKNRLSVNRVLKVFITLLKIQQVIDKPLHELDEKDLETINLYLVTQKTRSGKTYSLNTQNDWHKILKIWIRFTIQDEKLKNTLIASSELVVKNPYFHGYRLDPATLPTDEEVLALMNALPLRMRAFLALLDGGGLRKGSAQFLRHRDLQFFPDGSLVISFDSKTGRNTIKIRKDLAVVVAEWINHCPSRKENDFVFPNRKGEAMSDQFI